MLNDLGIRFQPGADASFEQRRDRAIQSRGTADGVQTAIQMLSFRLPKVVGPRAVAPTPLLTSPGSDGDSLANSMVQRVITKYFPTSTPDQAQAPSIPDMPQPQAQTPSQSPASSARSPFFGTAPRIIFDSPFGHGDLMTGPDGRPMNRGGNVGGIFESLPGTDFGRPATIAPLPDLLKSLEWLAPSWSAPSRDETPLI